MAYIPRVPQVRVKIIRIGNGSDPQDKIELAEVMKRKVE